jgi:hypothetical protein
MNGDELRDFLKKAPFKPFEIEISTGERFPIRHPNLLMVGKRSAGIGVVKSGRDEPYDYIFTVDLFHIIGVHENAESVAKNGSG